MTRANFNVIFIVPLAIIRTIIWFYANDGVYLKLSFWNHRMSLSLFIFHIRIPLYTYTHASNRGKIKANEGGSGVQSF